MLNMGASGVGPVGLTLKAWGLITGAGALVSGFNVASVTKSAAGTYSVTFNSAVCATAGQAVADLRVNMGSALNNSANVPGAAIGTTTMVIYTWNDQGSTVALADAAQIHFAVWG